MYQCLNNKPGPLEARERTVPHVPATKTHHLYLQTQHVAGAPKVGCLQVEDVKVPKRSDFSNSAQLKTSVKQQMVVVKVSSSEVEVF